MPKIKIGKRIREPAARNIVLSSTEVTIGKTSGLHAAAAIELLEPYLAEAAKGFIKLWGEAPSEEGEAVERGEKVLERLIEGGLSDELFALARTAPKDFFALFCLMINVSEEDEEAWELVHDAGIDEIFTALPIVLELNDYGAVIAGARDVFGGLLGRIIPRRPEAAEEGKED